jgi:anti-sigma regulatory factor (Ser/Thr protein kinase)
MDMSLRLPADANAPAAARQTITDALGDVPGRALGIAQLIVSELVTNSVCHAPGTPLIGLHVATSAERIRIEVSDEGPGFDPELVHAPDAPDAPVGWGLHIIDRVADRWGVVRGPPTYSWAEVDL